MAAIAQSRPGYQSGFAPRDGVSANSGLWKGCKGLWFPGLGISGTKIFDWSGHGHDLDFRAGNEPSWDLIPQHGYGVMCDGGTTREWVEGAFSGISSFPLTMWSAARADGADVDVLCGLVFGNAGNSYLAVGLESGSKIALVARNTSFVRKSGGAFAAGDFVNQTAVFASAIDRRLYRDGVFDVSDTSSVTIPTLSKMEFGKIPFSSFDKGDQTFLACGIWDRELIVSEMKILSVDPFAMVRLAPQFIPFVAAVAVEGIGARYDLVGGGISIGGGDGAKYQIIGGGL